MNFPAITSSACHKYEIEATLNGVNGEVCVDANTRSQAAAIARKAGYTVRSVNMVG